MDQCTMSEIPILNKYSNLVDTISWCQTRELMLSVLRPYLKKKDITPKEFYRLPIDDDGVEHTTEIANEDVEWYNKFVENYKKGNK